MSRRRELPATFITPLATSANRQTDTAALQATTTNTLNSPKDNKKVKLPPAVAAANRRAELREIVENAPRAERRTRASLHSRLMKFTAQDLRTVMREYSETPSADSRAKTELAHDFITQLNMLPDERQSDPFLAALRDEGWQPEKDAEPAIPSRGPNMNSTFSNAGRQRQIDETREEASSDSDHEFGSIARRNEFSEYASDEDRFPTPRSALQAELARRRAADGQGAGSPAPTNRRPLQEIFAEYLGLIPTGSRETTSRPLARNSGKKRELFSPGVVDDSRDVVDEDNLTSSQELLGFSAFGEHERGAIEAGPQYQATGRKRNQGWDFAAESSQSSEGALSSVEQTEPTLSALPSVEQEEPTFIRKEKMHRAT